MRCFSEIKLNKHVHKVKARIFGDRFSWLEENVGGAKAGASLMMTLSKTCSDLECHRAPGVSDQFQRNMQPLTWWSHLLLDTRN